MHRLHPRLGFSVALVCVAPTWACTLEIVDTLIGAADQVDQADGETGTFDSRADDEGNDQGGDEGGGQHGDTDEPSNQTLFDVGVDEQMQVTSCDFAAEFPSHLGCEFFGIDVDGPGLFDFEPFGFVVINPLGEPVRVELERHTGRSWALVDEAVIAGESEHVFLPAHNQALGTGIHSGATLRITSEHPIVVIQAHAGVGAGISTSATMLQPTTAWSSRTPVAGWRTHQGVGERAYLAVIASSPGTSVMLRPNFDVSDSPAQWVDHWTDVDDDGEPELILPLDPSELLRFDAGAIDAVEVDHGTSGSVIESGREHRTAAFSAHTCAAIPDYAGTCGHMQEQLSAALIGQRFVAPRMVASGNPLAPLGPLTYERTMVQVVALEPDTEIVFGYHDGNVGAELETVVIDPEEPYAIYQSERDLAVVANKPVVCTAYMTNAELTHLGSPSMVQLAPVDQWTGHHWVWVPDGFETHLLVSASPSANVEVEWLSGLTDDAPPAVASELAGGLVAAPGGQPRAVRRFDVEPGIHRVRSSGPSSVIVAGWRDGDGFAYLGGWGPSFADLGPEG